MDNETWREYREKHIEELANPDSGLNITSAVEYICKFTNICPKPSVGEISKADRQALEEMTNAEQGSEGLKGFCRVYPRNDQDVMIVFSNPKLSSSGFKGSDNYRLSMTDDMEKREQISMEGSYILRENDKGQAKKTREMMSKLSESAGNLESIQIPLPTEPEEIKDVGHEGIYYTNFYKFATENSGKIPEWAKDNNSIASKFLQEEIRSIDPSIIIVFGATAWKYGFKERVVPTDDTHPKLEESSISDVKGLPMKEPETDTRVIPLEHPAGPISYDQCKKLC
jgi:hypothetical protein